MVTEAQDKILGIIAKAPPKDVYPADMLCMGFDTHPHGDERTLPDMQIRETDLGDAHSIDHAAAAIDLPYLQQTVL